MKSWMKRLIDQFGVDWQDDANGEKVFNTISEAKATLLHSIDTYSRHLIDVEGQPVKKVRETFEELAKLIMSNEPEKSEKGLFRFRQFFNSYRIDEYTYIQNTFDDFKNVIWDFADQLGEEFAAEKNQDQELLKTLDLLRDAVEANSIDDLRSRSREFIDFYVSFHAQRDSRRNRRMDSIQKNLEEARVRLSDATKSAQIDHLTNINNRRSFDEKIRKVINELASDKTPASLLIIDIDFFKRINDTFGHDVGDFVLKECVQILKEVFSRDKDFIARIGGEEFAVILPGFRIQEAMMKAEQALERFRKDAVVTGPHTIKFTASIGIAQLLESETYEHWLKRADEALYKSKANGRDQLTIAPQVRGVDNVA